MGYYLLHIAIMNDNSEGVVMNLIEVFPEAIMETTTRGKTALNLACDNKNISETVIAKLIARSPLAIQEKDHEAKFPIHFAIDSDRTIAVIKLLLDADPLGIHRSGSNTGDYTLFHLACMRNNNDLVEYFMQRSDHQINVMDRHGKTPLHYSCDYTEVEVVYYGWEEPGVDLNAFHDPPLYMPQKYYDNPYDYDPEKRVNAVKKLLDHPCILINEKNINDKTPLDLIKAYLDDVENIREDTRAEEVQYGMKMIHLLEEYPIKKRWKAYCYHVESFIGL